MAAQKITKLIRISLSTKTIMTFRKCIKGSTNNSSKQTSEQYTKDNQSKKNRKWKIGIYDDPILINCAYFIFYQIMRIVQEDSTQIGKQSHNQHTEPLVILFIFIGLFIGGILRQVNKKYKIPYTPLLLVVGIILGYGRYALGDLGEGVHIISQINPHMILLIFIPVLIFESAFNCDWYIFRRSLVNILILAGPGVLWGSILLGSCIKLLLGYSDDQINWYQALTMGSILSATDPVAVVALLKQLGASGQSLLNDGTAMVFYMLFIELVKGNSSSAGQVVLNFVRIALGGPLLGLCIGIISSYFIKKIIRDEVLTTNVTFVACYMCFYLAEFSFLHVSGILSIVVLGLFLSAVGKSMIYSQSQHSLHVIWSYVQYGCQTIIFLLTGVIVGVEMIAENTITVSDWIKLIIFWFIMQAMRFCMICTFLPILKKFGYGLTKKEFIVLIYGGLRGALGLCLSLMVGVDDELDVRFRQLTVFYMSGIATMSLLINGTTCSWLVKYVEMIEIPPIKQRIYRNCLNKLDKQNRDQIEMMQSDRFLSLAEWKKVQQICKDERIQKEMGYRNTIVYQRFQSNEILKELRFRIINQIKKIGWERYQQGKCYPNVAHIISQACDVQSDNLQIKLHFWELLKSNFTGFKGVKLAQYFKDYPFIGRIARYYILEQIYLAYDTCTSFIRIVQQIEELFNRFPIKEIYLKKVMDELHIDQLNAQNYISQLDLTFPTAIRNIQTRMALNNVLSSEKDRLIQLRNEGHLSEADYNNERDMLDNKLLYTSSLQLSWQHVSYHDIAMQCPLFSTMRKNDISEILQNSAEKVYKRKTLLQERQRQVQMFFLIVEGSVTEYYNDDYDVTLGAGSLISLPNLLNINNISFCRTIANTDCKLLMIKPNVLRKIFIENKQFEKRVFASTLPAIVKLKKQNRMANWRDLKIKRLAKSAKIVQLKSQEKFILQFGGFLFAGRLKMLDEEEKVYETFDQLPPSSDYYLSINYCTLLVFTQIIQTERVTKIEQQ